MALRSAQARLWPLLQRRWLRFSVQAVVVLVCLAYLGINLRNASGLLAGLQIRWLHLGAAWLITSFVVFLGALGWWLTLHGLGQPAGLVSAMRAHLLSNLAKYIPGYAWQLMGKAYLSRKSGISSRPLGLGMVLELAQLVLSGLILAAILLPGELAARWTGLGGGEILALRWAAALSLAALSFAILHVLTRRVMSGQEGRVNPWFFLAAMLVMALGWLLFGFSFWLMGDALQPLQAADIVLFTFTLITSFLIGLAIVFVPGSIGVRESIMVFILGAAGIPAGLAVIVAALSRVVVTLSELAGAFALEAILRRFSNVSEAQNTGY